MKDAGGLNNITCTKIWYLLRYSVLCNLIAHENASVDKIGDAISSKWDNIMTLLNHEINFYSLI